MYFIIISINIVNVRAVLQIIISMPAAGIIFTVRITKGKSVLMYKNLKSSSLIPTCCNLVKLFFTCIGSLTLKHQHVCSNPLILSLIPCHHFGVHNNKRCITAKSHDQHCHLTQSTHNYLFTLLLTHKVHQ